MENNQLSVEGKIHACCIPLCQKSCPTEQVLYFPFPHHDHELLKKWKTQIGIDQLKLTKNSYICSKHFVDSDIDNHPNRKIPVLKSTAIPKIFNGYSPVKKINLKDIDKNIVSINKKNVQIIKLQQDNIIEKIDETDDIEVITHKKIPSKLQKPSVCYLTPVKQITKQQKETKNKSPFIMIIPKFDNAKTPPSKEMVQPRHLSLTNKAILRITIGKKINNEEKQDKLIDKFQTKNEKTNTIVTYTLDPVSGDIKITKEIQPKTTTTTTTTTNGEVAINNRRKSRRICRSINPSELTTIADEVKKDLTNVKAENDDLEKHHKNLVQTHKMLKEKKQKLQDEVTEMKNKVKRTLNDSSKVPIDNKRKKSENSIDKEHLPYETRTRKKIENDNVKDNLPYETRTRKKAQSMNINNFSTPEDVGVNGSPTNKLNRENIINKIEFVDINKIKSAEMMVKLE